MPSHVVSGIIAPAGLLAAFVVESAVVHPWKSHIGDVILIAVVAGVWVVVSFFLRGRTQRLPRCRKDWRRGASLVFVAFAVLASSKFELMTGVSRYAWGLLFAACWLMGETVSVVRSR